MAENNVIKEFLVAVGFRLDRQGLSEMQRAVGQLRHAFSGLGSLIGSTFHLARRSFALLVETVSGTSGGLIYAIERTAQSFFNLYFAAQRVGSTTQNVLAGRFAGGQIGLPEGALEGQAQALRMSFLTSPGTTLLTGALGVSARGPGGGLRDTEETYLDIARHFATVLKSGNQLRIAQEAAILQSLGLDLQIVLQTAQNIDKLDASRADYVDKLKKAGLSTDQVAKDSVAFVQAQKSIFNTLAVLWAKILDDILPALTPALEHLNAFLVAHAKEIGEFFDRNIRAFIDWLQNDVNWEEIKKGFINAFEWVRDQDWKGIFGGIIDALKWITHHLHEIKVAAEVVAAFFVTRWAANMILAITSVAAALKANPMVMAFMMLAAGLGITSEYGFPRSGFKPGDMPSDNDQESVFGHWWGGIKKFFGFGGGKGGGGAEKEAAPGVPYEAGSILKSTGATQEQYDEFRNRLAAKESGGRYDIMGGDKKHFAGRYQIGAIGHPELAEASRYLGIPTPSVPEFLHDPQLQERIFEAYTAMHDEELSKNPAYRALPPDQKLAVLAMAHLGGVRTANEFLRSGTTPFRDANQTSAMSYYNMIRRRLAGVSGTLSQGSPLGGPSVNTAAGDTTTFNAPINNQVSVNVQGGDAEETGRHVRMALDRSNADMVRHLRGVAAEVG